MRHHDAQHLAATAPAARNRSPWRRAAGAALVVGLVLGGCSSGDDEADETTAATEATAPTETTEGTSDTSGALDSEVPDLCTIFTADDFQTVTGEVALAPESEPAMGAIRGTCTINAEAGFPLAVIGAYNESDREATMAMVETEPVDELDREAYWDETLGIIVPLEGKDWYLQVMITGGGADREASVQAAQIALDRLDG